MPAELFVSEHIRKWGRNRHNGSFDSNSKIWYNRLGFRGRGQRSVVSPTSHCPGMRAKPGAPNPRMNCIISVGRFPKIDGFVSRCESRPTGSDGFLITSNLDN